MWLIMITLVKFNLLIFFKYCKIQSNKVNSPNVHLFKTDTWYWSLLFFRYLAN